MMTIAIVVMGVMSLGLEHVPDKRPWEEGEVTGIRSERRGVKLWDPAVHRKGGIKQGQMARYVR